MNRDDSHLSSLSDEDDYHGDNGNEMDDNDEAEDAPRKLPEKSACVIERKISGILRKFQRVPNSPIWSPKSSNWPPTRLPKMIPTGPYRHDFAKFSLNCHYNTNFPTFSRMSEIVLSKERALKRSFSGHSFFFPNDGRSLSIVLSFYKHAIACAECNGDVTSTALLPASGSSVCRSTDNCAEDGFIEEVVTQQNERYPPLFTKKEIFTVI
ncbi:hypothetical protein TNCV_1790071 [Trichonephila clavipes]|nr:hypothetical protein TNCV_1790071 [Trichonephila clavipes]